MFNHLFDIKKKIRIQTILDKCLNSQPYAFDIARFDEIHPIVSGNKLFKLKYNIEEAIKLQKKGILTMGGPFSNHLVATAYLCHTFNMPSIGMVRGEIPKELSHTLSSCINQNMQLIPVERAVFNEKSQVMQRLINEYSDFHFIPMGGSNDAGIRGAAEMTDMVPNFESYDLIFCAIGSGTMTKGIQKKILPHQQLIGIPVMKIKPEEREDFMLCYGSDKRLKIYFDFAGKGYGKTEPRIIEFISQMLDQHQLPLDFVYTGKLVYAIRLLIEKGAIDRTKKILAIHSGGLQGNLSL
ncbi:MAG: 1-aminocyclopropane-1-carboxylate deaminase/D-cysteine desulfhydrase [Bacteroidota bacterium]